MATELKLTESRVEKKKSKKERKDKEEKVKDTTHKKKKEKKEKVKVDIDGSDVVAKEKKKKSKRDRDSDSETSERKVKKAKKEKKKETSDIVPQEIVTEVKEETLESEIKLEKTTETIHESKTSTTTEGVEETTVTTTVTNIETAEAKPTPKKKKSMELVQDLTDIPGESSEQRLLRLLDDPTEDEENKNKIGRFLAVDCEMVGVGHKGSRSVLARVSIVNFYGRVLIDKYVKPTEQVTDYRTFVSGIKPNHVRSAPPFAKVQKEVAELINNRVLVGHSIHHDLEALKLEHPPELIRDTSLYHHYRAVVDGHTPGLKRLAKEIFNLEIQGGSHSSVTDAQATMLLFRKWKKTWDRQIKRQNNSLKKTAAKTNQGQGQGKTEEQSNSNSIEPVKTE
ncbi:3'-5' exonuclease [Basidiobolus ranarum]|uniref:RNA exonuclease 4 n=1 Tax=Basidiobolus ranarum TaxID=34480 RepID=A0ABR2WAF0_9FUNG